MEKDVLSYVTNPLNAFAIIKRATWDLRLFQRRFDDQLIQVLVNTQDIRPREIDIHGAIEGLFRLQFIYKLKSADLANGIIDGKKTREPFTPHDLFVIGEHAAQMTDHEYFAIEYLEMVWNQLREGLDPDNEVDEKAVLTNLTTCTNRTGDFDKALTYTKILIEKFPESMEYADLQHELETAKAEYGTSKLSMFDPFSDHFVKDGIYSAKKENVIFSQVCRGNLTKSPLELSLLHCRYVSTNPFTKLARFQVEEVNIDPYIVVFIDVISDEEINFVIDSSKSKVKRATIRNENGSVPSNYRVAQNAWFTDDEHELYARISQRIEV